MEQDDQLLAQEIRAHYFPGETGAIFYNIFCLLFVFWKYAPYTSVISPNSFSGDGEINFWTFAMIGISCTFLVFVGFSVFIMW